MVTTLPYPLNPAKEELDSIVIHKNGRPTPGNKAGNTTIGRDGVGLQIPNRKPGAAPGAPVKKETKPRQRKRVNTAEKRASHNAVERQRRETLNGRFLDLARLLPNLATLRRPSKSSIVNASITHLGHQREQRLLAARELRALFSDLQELLNEVNEWRSRSGLQLRTGVGEWTEGMEEVVSVENEVFGNFLGVGENGDNEGEMAEGEEPEEEDDKAGVNNSNNEPSSATTQQQQTPFSAQFPNHAGLFTPRSSTATSSGDMNFPSAGGYPSYGNNSFSLPGSVDFSGSNTQDSAFLAMQQQQQQGGALNSFLPDSFHGPGGAGNDIDHNSVQSLGQSPTGVSVAGSFGDHVLTPPPPSFAMMEGNGNGMGAGTQVQTYLESPPPSTVAATSFALSNNDGDRVSDWAANQLMLGLSSNGQQHNGMNGVQAQMCFDGSAQYDRRLSNQSTQMFGTPNSNAQNSPSNSGNSKFPVRSNSNGFQYDSSPVTNEFTGNSNSGAQNRLTATHQSLLLSQPQLAAAVFPSSSSSSPPNSSTGFPGHEANEAALQAQAQIVKAAAGLGLSSDQMAEWKRFAMGNFLAERMNKQQQAQAQNKQGGSMAPPRSQQQQQQLPTPTMEELREAVRAGMTVGMGLFQGHQGMNHQWNHGQGVETD